MIIIMLIQSLLYNAKKNNKLGHKVKSNDYSLYRIQPFTRRPIAKSFVRCIFAVLIYYGVKCVL